MQEHDMAIPMLPCKSVQETAAFYARLGFDATIWDAPHSYAILTRDTVELHFFRLEGVDPSSSSSGCYIRVLNVDLTHGEFANANLRNSGIPRMDRVENKPWGMREFAIVDPDGNLIRIGQAL